MKTKPNQTYFDVTTQKKHRLNENAKAMQIHWI